MKHKLSARATSPQRTTRTPRMVACAVIIVILVTSARVEAQSSETSGVGSDATQFSADAISHREEELRRKEAELLRAINSGTSLPTNVEQVRVQSSEPIVTDSVKVSAPLEVPIKTVTELNKAEPSTEAEAVSKTTQRPQFNALQEVENHPALESKKAVVAPPPIQRVKVTSRESTSRSRKPDTFRRVDRDSESINSAANAFTSSKTISLREIEAERDRPAPYQYEAIATISGHDATLRTGPRNVDRALGMAPRFSEVSIDYRSGDWYRVRTGSGLRGWVQGRNLLFDAGISHRSAVRIGAVKRDSVERLSYRQ
jgi:hypothetical protein